MPRMTGQTSDYKGVEDNAENSRDCYNCYYYNPDSKLTCSLYSAACRNGENGKHSLFKELHRGIVDEAAFMSVDKGLASIAAQLPIDKPPAI